MSQRRHSLLNEFEKEGRFTLEMILIGKQPIFIIGWVKLLCPKSFSDVMFRKPITWSGTLLRQ